MTLLRPRHHGPDRSRPHARKSFTAFEKDNSPDAFAKVVDKLLASPHYGETLGPRSWLDVRPATAKTITAVSIPTPAAYRPYPNAWGLSRLGCIQAFNDDLPYDQFVKAQLAGDLMEQKNRYKLLPATGFLGLGPWYLRQRLERSHTAPTSVMTASTPSPARFNGSHRSPAPAATITSTIPFRRPTTTLSPASSTTPSYEEYPTAPKKVVDEYTRVQDEVDEKNKLLQEEENNALSTELTRAYAFQTAGYIEGVWDVVAQPGRRRKCRLFVESRKLDYEILGPVWSSTCRSPPPSNKNKDEFQANAQKGHRERLAAVKTFAEKFQGEVVEAMLAKADLDAQNKVSDRQGPRWHQAQKAHRQAQQLSFRTRTSIPARSSATRPCRKELSNFYNEVFVRELKDSDDPNAMMAAGGRQAGGGVPHLPRLGRS